jgi:putative membrane protein
MPELTAAPIARVSDRSFFVFAAVVSALALALIGYVLFVREHAVEGPDLRFLPALNATLNALASSLLVGGWAAIKRGAQRVHQYCMMAAFIASSLFLVGYLSYHYVHGDTRFAGTGAIRAVYLVVLASHVVLSMTIVPLALTSFFFAFQGRFDRHRWVARVTLPIWLYVSVTGVVIFFMLRGSLPAAP